MSSQHSLQVFDPATRCQASDAFHDLSLEFNALKTSTTRTMLATLPSLARGSVTDNLMETICSEEHVLPASYHLASMSMPMLALTSTLPVSRPWDRCQACSINKVIKIVIYTFPVRFWCPGCLFTDVGHVNGVWKCQDSPQVTFV